MEARAIGAVREFRMAVGESMSPHLASSAHLNRGVCDVVNNRECLATEVPFVCGEVVHDSFIGKI